MELTEAEIRPKAFWEQQKALFEQDVERLMKGSLQFREQSCPACGSDAFRVAFCKYEMRFTRCSQCRTVYSNPRPSEEAMRNYYLHSENYKFWAAKIYPATEAIRREKIFRPRVRAILDLCARFGTPCDDLLEIGPGFGTFCEEAISSGAFKRVRAVEPTPELAESLRNKNIQVDERFIEDISEEHVADVVVAYEVVEHMVDPGRFVRNVFRLLRPGGLLVLTAPNCDGLETLVLQEHSPAVDVEHLTLFNPRSLSLLLESAGFEVVQASTPGLLDIDIVANRLAQSDELTAANPFFDYVANHAPDSARRALQELVTSQGLSSNLQVVGRRRS
jgi:2-polyprenyl-3-methyl-5-hydroxy-6-metoxy-1,4-benzoquinol methylase